MKQCFIFAIIIFSFDQIKAEEQVLENVDDSPLFEELGDVQEKRAEKPEYELRLMRKRILPYNLDPTQEIPELRKRVMLRMLKKADSFGRLMKRTNPEEFTGRIMKRPVASERLMKRFIADLDADDNADNPVNDKRYDFRIMRKRSPASTKNDYTVRLMKM